MSTMPTDPPERDPIKEYFPDPLGRVGRGTWRRRRTRQGAALDAVIEGIRRAIESGQPMHAAFGSSPYELDTSVGRRGDNDRIDVAKIETLLGKSGYLDLDATEGPTGYYGARVEDALKRFQRDGGLKIDGLARPDGPTMAALRRETKVAAKQNTPSLLHGTAPPPDEGNLEDAQQNKGDRSENQQQHANALIRFLGQRVLRRPPARPAPPRDPKNDIGKILPPPLPLPPNEPEKPKDRQSPQPANEADQKPIMPGGSLTEDFVREILRPLENRRGNAATQYGNKIVAQECMKVAHEYSKKIEHIGGATPNGQGGKDLPEKYYRNIDTPTGKDGRKGSSFADLTFGLMEDGEKKSAEDHKPKRTANINTASEKRPGEYTKWENSSHARLAKNIGHGISAMMPKFRFGDDEEEYRKRANDICRKVFEKLIRPVEDNKQTAPDSAGGPMP